MYESVSLGDNASLVSRVIDLLVGGRAGLVTDVDGTISPIVPRPEDAAVLPRARDSLRGLAQMLELVGVVSGRRAADARAMVGLDGLSYVGNHGLEMWTPAGGAEIVPEARPWVARLAAVLDAVQQQLPQDGILVENKGATGSLHYRLTEDPDGARRQLLQILARRAITSGLRIEEGRMVINLLPPLTVTKGSAVTWLARSYGLERVVYLGDDVTDAHAFRALAALRQSSTARTLSIGVVGRETPPSVRQLADATVPSVEAVADLLWEVLDQLRAGASMDRRAPSVGSERYGQGCASD